MSNKWLRAIFKWSYKQKWFVWGVGNFLLVGISLYFVFTSSLFSVNKIEISYHHHQDIVNWYAGEFQRFESEVNMWRGRKIWYVYFELRKIKKDFWMENVQVEIVLPDTIKIQLIASRPLFIKRTKSNLVPYFAHHQWGRPIPIDSIPGNWTIVEVSSSNADQEEAIWNEVIQFFHQVTNTKVALRPIKLMRYTPEAGFTVYLYDTDAQVLLGNALTTGRIRRVTHVLDYLRERKIEARVIDAEFDKKVLVRLRNQF